MPGSLRELRVAMARRVDHVRLPSSLAVVKHRQASRDVSSGLKYCTVSYTADLADAMPPSRPLPAIVSQRVAVADRLGGLFKDICQLTFDVDVMAESLGPISIDRTRSRLTDRGNDRSESGMV